MSEQIDQSLALFKAKLEEAALQSDATQHDDQAVPPLPPLLQEFVAKADAHAKASAESAPAPGSDTGPS